MHAAVPEPSAPTICSVNTASASIVTLGVSCTVSFSSSAGKVM
jgi:hypothetical protein